MKNMMKHTFKHIIATATLSAAAMMSGLSAIAQNLPANVYMDQDGIAYRKTATHNDDGTYTIDLETFVTGKVNYVESADPSDIVLVLDVSGSMKDPIISYEYSKSSVSSITGGNGYNNNTKATNYYYEYEDKYYQVFIGRTRRNGYYFLFFTVNGTRHHINLAGEVVLDEPHEVVGRDTNLLGSGVQLYTRRAVGTQSKMEALKTAVKGFIKAIEDNAYKDKKGQDRNNPLDHQIAIVKFAGAYYYNDDATAWTHSAGGNHTYNDGIYTYNYTEVVRGLTSVLTNKGDLDDAIDNLSPGGATASDLGMQLAENIVNHIPSSRNSNKTVVFFTDGEPNHYRDFDKDVADKAIYNSYQIKSISYSTTVDGETKTTYPNVFSVGVFASEPQPGEDIYEYMNRISSNYPGATSMTNTCTKESSDFYKDASGGAAKLEEIFQAIAGSAASMDSDISSSSAVTVDVVSSPFSVPTNAEDAHLEVLVAKCNGVTTIGGKKYLTFGAEQTPEDAGLPPIEATISSADNTVSTTGFDFSANFCGPDESTTPVSYRGYKQIIRFTIDVRDDAVGGPSVQTNESASGIYVDDPENPGKKKQIAEFNRPTVKLPVNIWIQKDGLEGEDSAVITIYRYPFDINNPTYDPSKDPKAKWEHFTKVLISNADKIKVYDENGEIVEVTGKKVSGLSPDYYYKLKEDAWAFTYQYQLNNELFTVGEAVPENPFKFTNTPKDIKAAEANVRNVFKEKKAGSGGTGM